MDMPNQRQLSIGEARKIRILLEARLQSAKAVRDVITRTLSKLDPATTAGSRAVEAGRVCLDDYAVEETLVLNQIALVDMVIAREEAYEAASAKIDQLKEMVKIGMENLEARAKVETPDEGDEPSAPGVGTSPSQPGAGPKFVCFCGECEPPKLH